MYVADTGRSAQLELPSHESRDILKILEFRVRCRDEKKTGMIALGFGSAFRVGPDGEYLDGVVPEPETRLSELLGRLNPAWVPG